MANFSYTNKDYESIYSELMQLSQELSSKWNPGNEADPGVVLIKLMSYLGDVLSYNEDRNFQEMFPSTVTQQKNARVLFELLGYTMKWYQSAEIISRITNKYVVENFGKVEAQSESTTDDDGNITKYTDSFSMPTTTNSFTIGGVEVLNELNNIQLNISIELDANRVVQGSPTGSYVDGDGNEVVGPISIINGYSVNKDNYNPESRLFSYHKSKNDVLQDYSKNTYVIKEGVTQFTTEDNSIFWYHPDSQDMTAIQFDGKLYPNYDDNGANGGYSGVKDLDNISSIDINLFESPISPMYLGASSIANNMRLEVTNKNISQNTIRVDYPWSIVNSYIDNSSYGCKLVLDEYDNPSIELYVVTNSANSVNANQGFSCKYLLSSGRVDVIVGDKLMIQGIYDINDSQLSDPNITASVISILNYGSDPETAEDARKSYYNNLFNLNTLITVDDYNNVIKNSGLNIQSVSCTDATTDVTKFTRSNNKVILRPNAVGSANIRSDLGSNGLLVNSVSVIPGINGYLTISNSLDINSSDESVSTAAKILLSGIMESIESKKAITTNIMNSTELMDSFINFCDMKISLIISSKDITKTHDNYRDIICRRIAEKAEFGRIFTESDILDIVREYDSGLVSLGVNIIYNYTLDDFISNNDNYNIIINNIIRLITNNQLPTNLKGTITKDGKVEEISLLSDYVKTEFTNRGILDQLYNSSTGEFKGNDFYVMEEVEGSSITKLDNAAVIAGFIEDTGSYDHEVNPFDYSDIRNPLNKITIPRVVNPNDITISMNNSKWVK